MSRETHIPTKQSSSQTSPRLSVADGYEKRSEGTCAPPRQGPQASERLSNETSDSSTGSPVVSARVERLHVRREFLFVAGGHDERRKSVVVQARQRTDDSKRVRAGFTATRKIGGAVVRNRAKRRLREVAQRLLPHFGYPGADYVFIARRDSGEIDWQRLLDDAESALISLRSSLESGKPPRPRPPFRGRKTRQASRRPDKPAPTS